MHPDNMKTMDDVRSFREYFLVRMTDVYQQLLRDKDNLDPKIRRGTGRAYYGLGMTLFMIGQRAKARENFDKATAIQERLKADFPGRPEYLYDLATTYNGLGDLWQAEGQKDQAIAAYRQSADLIDVLLSQDPRALAWVIQFSHKLHDMGKYQENVDLTTKFIDRLQTMLTQEPQPARRQAIAITLQGLHVIRAYACLKLGRYAKMEADVEIIAADPDALPYFLYDCAQSLSQASSAKLPEVNIPGKEAAERYAAQAVELLRKAAARGFFKDQATIEQMKMDADLEPLRGRADYQQFLDSLTVPNQDHDKSKDRRHDNQKIANPEPSSPGAKPDRSRAGPGDPTRR
jgi:tetratricopeptide (TPR) repeat protein